MKKVILRHALEAREQEFLAPYGVLSSKTFGREHAEDEDDTRTVFQRDRDRIIHCKAFRRLSGKTQVFGAAYKDHVRDRLSHTLEVAQIARDLARNLSVNEDLTEAIALAHDLGHPPFAHAGEQQLDELVRKFGLSFEHNDQSQRIVELLERQSPRYMGLNLTYEVRDGLAKHQTRYDRAGKKISGKTLEAQIADVADEIAYHNHDLDDGLRAKLFTLKDLNALSLWRRAELMILKKYGQEISSEILQARGVSKMISLMIQNILETTSARISKKKIKTLEDVLEQKDNLVGFSAAFEKEVSAVRGFLWQRMYQAPKVVAHSKCGQRIIAKVFRHLYRHPQLIPSQFFRTIEEPLEVMVKDYVAGMTDRFITYIFEKL